MTEAELKKTREAAERVFAGKPVFLAYAYGSRVCGNPMPQSDLDVGYYLHHGDARDELEFGEEMRIAGRLSVETGYEVDLRCLQRAPLELRARARIEGERIYCTDASAAADLESLVLRMYFDQKEILQRMHRERLESMAREFAEHG